MVAGAGLALALSACGGGSNQAASEPSGNFTVKVSRASFPASQRLAEEAEHAQPEHVAHDPRRELDDLPERLDPPAGGFQESFH